MTPGALIVISVRASSLVDAARGDCGLDELRWYAERLLSAVEKAQTGRPRDPRTGVRT